MKTIHITDKYRPGMAYTDYVVAYVNAIGTTKGILRLTTFCKRMTNGGKVKVGQYIFTASL